jgi:hypothetical protein
MLPRHVWNPFSCGRRVGWSITVRQPDPGRLRGRVPQRPDLRRWRRLRRLRFASDAIVCSGDLRRPAHHVRPGGRRLRQHDRELRDVRSAGHLRRWRRVESVREQAGLRSPDLPAAQHRMRPGRRRLRQPDPGRLRRLHASRHVRRRRDPGSVRRLHRALEGASRKPPRGVPAASPGRFGRRLPLPTRPRDRHAVSCPRFDFRPTGSAAPRPFGSR